MMRRPARPAALAAVSFLVAMAATPALEGEEQVTFGNLRISAQDIVSPADPAIASSLGMGPGSQILVGQVQLDLNERIRFEGGELYAADSLLWWQGSDGGSLQNDLMQAYVSVTPLPALTFTVGKQRLAWGAGYAFFPGDRINPPMSPQNRSEGFLGIAAAVTPSASFSVTAAVRFDTAFADLGQLPGLPSGPGNGLSALAAFLEPYLPSAPSSPWLALRYVIFAEAFLGNLDVHAAGVWQWQRVLRPSLGFSVDILGFILDAEAAVELSNTDLYPAAGGSYASPGFGTPFPVFTIGLQRTVSSDTASFTATLEYLYDGTGYNADQAGRFLDDFFAALSAASGPLVSTADLLGSTTSGAWFASGEVIPALARHYTAVSVTASVTRAFSVTGGVVLNLQDLSCAVQAEIRMTRLEGIDLFARVMAGVGRDSRSEFGSVPVPLDVGFGALAHF